MSQPLIDHIIKVGSKLFPVDAHVRARQRRDLFAGNEATPSGPQGPKLGDRLAVTRDDEGRHDSRADYRSRTNAKASSTCCISWTDRNPTGSVRRLRSTVSS